MDCICVEVVDWQQNQRHQLNTNSTKTTKPSLPNRAQHAIIILMEYFTFFCKILTFKWQKGNVLEAQNCQVRVRWQCFKSFPECSRIWNDPGWEQKVWQAVRSQFLYHKSSWDNYCVPHNRSKMNTRWVPNVCNKLAGNFIRDCNMFKSNCEINNLTLADVSDTSDSNPHRLLKKNICCDSLIVKQLGNVLSEV